MAKKTDRSTTLLGVRLFGGSLEQVLETMADRLSDGAHKGMMTVFTPNPEQVVLANNDDRFCHTLNQSTVNVVDGIGLVWADRYISWRTGREWKIRERVAGIELAEALVREAVARKKRVFLLGGGEGVGKQAVDGLIVKLSNCQIANYRSGRIQDEQNPLLASPLDKGEGQEKKDPGSYLDWHQGSLEIATETGGEREEALRRITEHKTEVLLVAYGAPWQEFWVMANRVQLEEAGVRVAMVVGGSFDVWAGKVKRAPLWMRKIGLEWLWRLLAQPWRWRRQLALVRFVGKVGLWRGNPPSLKLRKGRRGNKVTRWGKYRKYGKHEGKVG